MMDVPTSQGAEVSTIDRRDVLKRGAFVAGAVAFWSTPVVQTLGMRPAAAGTREFLECDSINTVWYRYTGTLECIDVQVAQEGSGQGTGGILVVDKKNLGGDQWISFDVVQSGKKDYDFFVKDACGEGDFQKVGETHLSCSQTADALVGFEAGEFQLIKIEYVWKGDTYTETLSGKGPGENETCSCP